MKKGYVYLLLSFFMIGGLNAFAEVSGFVQTAQNTATAESNSPYLDDYSGVIKIADLKNARDDEYVTIRGYVVKRIKKDKYLFKDSTGEVILEIDKKINSQLKNVDENTLVEVYGEYDKEYFARNKIDVKKITIVK